MQMLDPKKPQSICSWLPKTEFLTSWSLGFFAKRLHSACLPRKDQFSTQMNSRWECGDYSAAALDASIATPSEGPCPGGGTGQTQTGGRDEGCPSLGRHHCGSSRLGKAWVGRSAVQSFLWIRKKQLSAQTHSTELSALMARLAGNLGGKLTDCQSPRCTFSLNFCFQSRNCLRT